MNHISVSYIMCVGKKVYRMPQKCNDLFNYIEKKIFD